MATKYPYISSAGPVAKTIERFRKQFPAEVTAETLRKLGIAPKNESYVIHILKFLGVIDDDGKKVDTATKAFLQHDDSKFQEQFAPLVQTAYSELFELYGDDAWSSTRGDLVTFFRTEDSSSDIVGKRQAITFSALAALSGHGESIVPRAPSSATTKKAAASPQKPKPTVKAPAHVDPPVQVVPDGASRVGLTVRIEVNLPADGDQKTYDAIFRSIRKNLIDGE